MAHPFAGLPLSFTGLCYFLALVGNEAVTAMHHGDHHP